MQIIVSGKGMEVGESLITYVKEKIEPTVNTYLDRVSDVKVIFTKEGYRFLSEIVFNTGTHSKTVIKGNAECDDVYPSFDKALSRIEKQLRRYKSKLTSHHKQKQAKVEEAVKYVISPTGAEEEVQVGYNPLIVAEKGADIENLTVSQAVMKMDLADLPALLFINSANDRLNVVYHRKDGNISWVDPK